MKTLYTLVRDRLEGEDDKDILWDDEITKRLADFQKVAVRQARQMIKDYGGAFVSDVVGLGKSYIGAAIVKHFERTDHARALILCPAPLTDMWERYNEVYQLNARVLSMGMLREEDDGAVNMLLEDVLYKDRDFVLIDESHNLRHRDAAIQGSGSVLKHGTALLFPHGHAAQQERVGCLFANQVVPSG